MNIEQLWIKAAVEHRCIEVTYWSGRTKKELTTRIVEPDFVGIFRDGKQTGLWATFCHLRNEDPRCFKIDSLIAAKFTEKFFEPSPYGRWLELVSLYQSLHLAKMEV